MSTARRHVSATRWGAVAFAAFGCRGPQSALDPAGEGAARIDALFRVMAIGGLVVWVTMLVISIFAMRDHPESHGRRRGSLMIVVGGAIIPTGLLTALLVGGLAMLPSLVRAAPPGSLRVSITGEQWWWRVRYPARDGAAVELANEVHLPRGEVADLSLDSADVIHSFWVPPLGGKLDMFPGRVTRLALRPTRDGVFRGACAEYCGTAHAQMLLHAVVEPRPAFDRWLAHQAAPAVDRDARGARLFLSYGCGACHTVRGTPARGVIAPDLTHVASRHAIGAATLSTTRAHLARWIAHTGDVKPGVVMPSFDMVPRDEVEAIASWLAGLRGATRPTHTSKRRCPRPLPRRCGARKRSDSSERGGSPRGGARGAR